MQFGLPEVVLLLFMVLFCGRSLSFFSRQSKVALFLVLPSRGGNSGFSPIYQADISCISGPASQQPFDCPVRSMVVKCTLHVAICKYPFDNLHNCVGTIFTVTAQFGPMISGNPESKTKCFVM